ncbi:hypothetical protein PQQ77_31840 [Paraburkholderia strydomiana]|uniref:hypothetical protein n=1 Tax=Paraburkholderia strydomiana TaxID=1245417 RepID=UPI0038B8C0DD
MLGSFNRLVLSVEPANTMLDAHLDVGTIVKRRAEQPRMREVLPREKFGVASMIDLRHPHSMMSSVIQQPRLEQAWVRLVLA